MRVKTKSSYVGLGIGITFMGDVHLSGTYDYGALVDNFVSHKVHLISGDMFESPDETLLPVPVQRPGDEEDVAGCGDKAGADA